MSLDDPPTAAVWRALNRKQTRTQSVKLDRESVKRGAVCCGPVWCCGEPDGPHWGLGALAW